METEWKNVKDVFPKVGALVEVTTPSGDVSKLRLHKSGHWFTPDMQMYVYYQPVMWRYLDD